MTYTPLKHIVFVPGPPWALFVYQTEVSKAIKYLSAQPSTYSKRIRIVTAASSEGVPPISPGKELEMILSLDKSFNLWITNEIQEATIMQLDGRPVRGPSLIIEDIFSGGAALASKETHKLPIVAWWLMPAASLMRLQGGEEGQDAGITERVIQLDPQANDLLTTGSEKRLQDPSSQLVCIPGVPPHYVWELATQELPFMVPLIVPLLARWKNMIKHVDTLICCTTPEYEPVTATALSSAFNMTPFLIGPSVDLSPPHQPDPDSPVTQFLDRAYTEKGAHSVIYVAFGTFFFPPPSSKSLLMAALDEIPKAEFRFIFALSSESAQLEQSWMDAQVEAGNAIFPQWTNQTAVLEHPAIHYFLSHGGWNSSSEAIGDQPMNAIQIASGHDCGFELLQVRMGPSKFKAYQNGTDVEIVGTDDAVRKEMRRILELSKGPRGKHQRENAKMLGKVVSNSLAPGGSGDIGLESFGKALGLAQ